MKRITFALLLICAAKSFATIEDCRIASSASILASIEAIKESCEQLANSGNAEAAYALYSATLIKSFSDVNLRKESRKWLQISADAGNIEAQNQMGELFKNGDPESGLIKNNREAMKWFNKAANSGHRDAQFSLGVIYLNGIGTIKDYTAARNWFKKSALNNNYTAQYNLAIMYYYGKGMKPDLVRAYAWSSIAAANISSRIGFQQTIIDEYYSFRDEIESNLKEDQLKKAQELTISVSNTIKKDEKCFMKDNACLLLP